MIAPRPSPLAPRASRGARPRQVRKQEALMRKNNRAGASLSSGRREDVRRIRFGKPNRISGVVLLCVALMLSCAPTQENAQDKLTADEARSIAKEAYIFNYPLVMMYRTMYLQAIDPQSKSYSGGFGEVAPSWNVLAERHGHRFAEQRHAVFLRMGRPAGRAVGADHAEDRSETVLHQPVGRPLGLRARQSGVGRRRERWRECALGITDVEG